MELRWAAAADAGSQFRSRDLCPQVAGVIALGRPEALGEALRAADIPPVPSNRIAYVDGYGNLKTTLTHSAFMARVGSLLRVRIGRMEQEAVVSDGSFAVEQGQLAFAPGSSGWRGPRGAETRWMEFFLRGGSAWAAFGRPSVGEHVHIHATC